jgi:hypothetical protein
MVIKLLLTWERKDMGKDKGYRVGGGGYPTDEIMRYIN